MSDKLDSLKKSVNDAIANGLNKNIADKFTALIDEIEKKKAKKPVMLADFDLEDLKKQLQFHLDSIGTDDYRDYNEQYIYETAMQTFFGKDVFKYINAKT